MNDTRHVINNVAVLLDEFTKATVDSVMYDVLSKHASVLTDIREIGEEHKQAKVVVFEPALFVIVTPEILTRFIEEFEIKVYIIYQNEEVLSGFKGLAEFVYASYADISWNLVYAAINGDTAILEPYQKSLRILDSFHAVKAKLPEDMQEYIDRFRASYIEMMGASQRLLEENALLRETTDAQETIGRQTIAGLLELNSLMTDMQTRLHSYEALLSEDYDVTFGGFYPERPKVLYIKQVSHVAGIDTLLAVLFSVLTQQYKMSCKIVKLVDHTNALQMRYVPSTYVPLVDSYNSGDVLTNDFVVKLGAFKIMFDGLMLNRSGLDYLIVHDMRGTPNDALDTTLIDLRINEVSDDYAVLGQYDNVLCGTSKLSTFLWSFKDCQKFTGSRVVRLANHPTIGAILDLLI